MRYLILFLATLVLAQPISARPTLSESERNPVEVQATTEEIEAALETYGRWLVRLEQIQAPVQEAVTSLSPDYQAAMALGPREGVIRFEPAVERALAAIDQATAELVAVDPPVMVDIGLTDELQPDAIRTGLVGLNGDLRSALGQVLPAMDALARGDEEAARSGMRRFMEGIAIALDSQVLMRRASLATTPREDSTWEMQNIQLILDRLTVRTLAAVLQAMDQQPDASYAADLARLADELEINVRRGTEKLEEEMALYSAELEAAKEAGAEAEAGILTRLTNVLRISRGVFPIGGRLAERTRAVSAASESRPLRFATLRDFVSQLRGLRLEIGEISRQENEALATER